MIEQPIYPDDQSLGDGRYQIQRGIDEGGMQQVFLAQDTLLGRDVVIKVPKNRSGLKRFERSARLSAKVNHANTTRTYDYFIENERPHLVEEFVDGMDLSSFLKRMTLVDPHTCAYIFHQLARGLQAVARPGLVHRDLKPSNIMIKGALNLTGVKITDFGVADMADAEILEAVEGGSASLSASKTAIGAIPYMAPEVVDDPQSRVQASDVWSIGAIGYELLTGLKPFGQGLRATARILEAKAPPLPATLPQNEPFATLTREIYGLLLQCLAKEVSARPGAQTLVQLCGRLCYAPPFGRRVGTVKGFPARTFGFIRPSNMLSKDAMFHLDSVYGEKPEPLDKVWYRSWPGEPADRAHPVVRLKNEDEE